jgi:uncharacterized protein YdaU (DUF1376 family)
MSKDPAFLFYPNDYLGGTLGMTFEEKGAYMELLMLQFNRGHMTFHMIGQTVGQLWDNIKDKFTQDENGLYYNIRLEEEKNKRKRFTESRRNNLEGKNQYSKKKRAHMTSRMENENEDENINSIDNGIDFEIFWDAYDKKVGNKEKIKEKWDKLSEEIQLKILSHIGLYIQATPDKQYRLNPETYLNQKGWTHEIIKKTDGNKAKPEYKHSKLIQELLNK